MCGERAVLQHHPPRCLLHMNDSVIALSDLLLVCLACVSVAPMLLSSLGTCDSSTQGTVQRCQSAIALFNHSESHSSLQVQLLLTRSPAQWSFVMELHGHPSNPIRIRLLVRQQLLVTPFLALRYHAKRSRFAFTWLLSLTPSSL